MAQPYVIGNWKMYPTLSDSLVLASTYKKQLESLKGVHIVLAPPMMWLPSVVEAWGGGVTHVRFASQNVHPEDQGAYTGETSAYMVKDLADYAIVGHSERRRMGESNEQVREKLQACLRWKIRPILCIGESRRMLDEKDRVDSYQQHRLTDQMMEALHGVKKDYLHRVMIAYEPLWAVGTHKPASPQYVERVVSRLRDHLAEKYTKSDAEAVPFLYGGSVNADNAADYLRISTIDGVLPGEVSVKAREFIKICQVASKCRS